VESDFKSSYLKLNAAQKQAVDYIDGPLLVVAGPGTGKTQLLSLRVANILNKTDTDANSILCLTFTNYAATNMRERLTNLVGGSAHNVKVQTFHSFAAEIMQTHSDYFWNGAALSIVPDALQLEIIQDILADLALDNPLASKFAGNFTAVSDIMRSLSLAKEAGLTPAKLKAMIEVNQAYLDLIEDKLIEILDPALSFKKLASIEASVDKLPDQPIDEFIKPLSSLSRVLKEGLKTAIELDQGLNKTTNTGKWKKYWLQTQQGQKGMFDERRRNDWWLALAEVYEFYRNKLHSLGYYDYSDMIIEVITALEQNLDLLASVQENCLYVLIDEFQDTNAAQFRLADLVSGSFGSEDKANLMAVGDDDQTIFGFNGAELNNMLNFTRNYPLTKVIVLTENYRSSQKVLNSAKKIIEQADERLVNRLPEFDKKLKANQTFKYDDIHLNEFPTQEHELLELSKLIKSNWTGNKDQTIAVLARGHTSLIRLSYYLYEAQVPIRYEKRNNVLSLDLIVQLERLGKVILAIKSGDKETVNLNLSRLLIHPLWQIKPDKLWKLATSNHGRDSDWLSSLTKSKDKNMLTLAKWFIWLAQEASYQPLDLMLDYLLGLRASENLTSPIKEFYLSQKNIDNSYLETLSGLAVLRAQLNEFANNRDQETRLEDFIRFIQINKSLDKPVVDESWFSSSDKAVELMTVHKAKGLEFDTVYLLDANEANWQPRRLGRRPPANLPLQPYGEAFDDYARLAYVAATRAKHSFIVSSFKTDPKGQKVITSPLFKDLEIKDIFIDNSIEGRRATLESSLSWPRLEINDEKQLLKPKLNNYKLSATGLINFLDLSQGGPQHFLERELLRLPEATTDYMAYGTAIHYALQIAQNLVNDEGFSIDQVIEAYKRKLLSMQQPKNVTERYLAHGEGTLKRLFSELDFRLPKSGQAEVSISEASLGEVMLNGTLDHIYIEENRLTISDYKTGSSLPSFNTRAHDKVIKAWRQKTQLLFYCLLAKRSGRFKDVKSYCAQIVYVEAEDPKQLILRIEPTTEELIRLEKLIVAVWQHIQKLDFDVPKNLEENIEGILGFEEKLIN
jgi:DNA helicase-2/ATP-dependent DNA helicase PcrA